MAVIDRIPMPGTGFDGLVQGSDWMHKLLMAPVERRNKEAEAKHAEALANLPFGGHSFPGIAGKIQGIEALKMIYGDKSPQYQQASQMLQAEQQQSQQLMDYRRQLMQTAPKRASSPLGKIEQEKEDIRNGFLPGSEIPIPPAMQKDLLNRYGLQELKTTTDTDTRKRTLNSKNIEITLDNINPDDLTRYSGLKGAVNLSKDSAQAALGKSNENYDNYQKSLTASKLLAKQVRQFYGDSITPGVQEGLNKLTNPSTWMNNPDVAKKKFNQFKSILNQEMKTIRGGLTDPETFTGENSSEADANTGGSDEPVIIMYKGKDAYHIPAKFQNHPKLKGFTLEPT